MAGSVNPVVLLDANVFLSITATAVFMQLSVEPRPLLRLKWTLAIEQEWLRNLHDKKQLPLDKLTRRRDSSRDAIDDWEVAQSDFEPLLHSLSLPDADDCHVLAAAIAGEATLIATFNLKHFPSSALAPHGIEAVHRDQLLMRLALQNADLVLDKLRAQRLAYRSPAVTATAYAASCRRAALPGFADWLDANDTRP